MFKLQYLLCFLCFVLHSNAASVPIVTPCKAEDKACHVSSGQAIVPAFAAGFPEFGIPSVEPLKIGTVQAGDAGLKLVFNNVEILGMSNTKVISIERNPEKQTITLDLQSPIEVRGQYDLNGKLLILNAVGNGDFNIKTSKMGVHIVLKYKTIEKDGNKYWKVTGYDYTYDLIEKVNIKLENLFNGNEQLAKPIHELLNQEWKAMVTEIGGPLIKEVIAHCTNVIKKFFLAVPTKELDLA